MAIIETHQDAFEELLQRTYELLNRPKIHSHICRHCHVERICCQQPCAYRATDLEREWECGCRTFPQTGGEVREGWNMKAHLGEANTEQFTVTTRVDGKLIGDQPIHDPFIHNRTVVGISRWDLFRGLFRRQFKVKVEVTVRASDGAMRAIMMLDPVQLEAETKAILAERKESRERHARGDYSGTNCYSAGT